MMSGSRPMCAAANRLAQTIRSNTHRRVSDSRVVEQEEFLPLQEPAVRASDDCMSPPTTNTSAPNRTISPAAVAVDCTSSCTSSRRIPVRPPARTGGEVAR